MAYTLAADSYGSGNINGTHHEREAEPAKLHAAPPTASLALAEAHVAQVEAELRLILVEERYPALRSDCPTLKPSLRRVDAGHGDGRSFVLSFGSLCFAEGHRRPKSLTVRGSKFSLPKTNLG